MCAGFYNRVSMDSGYERGRDVIDQGVYDYNLFRSSVMRPNRIDAPFMTVAQNVDFYGPLTGNRVTKESFIQGRGHTLSRGPDNEVFYLPSSVFPQVDLKPTQCDRVDLEPVFTRVKPSCNGIKETDVFAYSLMPGHYEDGYMGYNSVVYSNLQTKMGPDTARYTYPVCSPNYASYKPSRSFERYAP
jgi:hypothetical protein